MAAYPEGFRLASAVSGRTKGVFTATVEWELKVSLSDDVVDMLPDRVAYLYRAYLPLEGSPYPGQPLCTCRGVEASTGDEAGLYKFSAKYSDENSFESKDPATKENPLLDRPIIKPVASIESRVMTKDRDGKAILNSAGDPILQSREFNTMGFKVSANVSGIPPGLGGLIDSCNAAPFTIRGFYVDSEEARFVLPSDWISDQLSRNGVEYYTLTFELLIDKQSRHYGYPLNAGFRELKEDELFNLVPTAITERDGSEPSEPVPLNEAGRRIENPTPENALYRETKKYYQADYSGLPGID